MKNKESTKGKWYCFYNSKQKSAEQKKNDWLRNILNNNKKRT
jgi:hypothetical protein